MKTLELISTLTTILGVYLISEQYYLIGWTVNGIGDLLWAVWGMVTKAFYLVALQLFLFLIAVNGLLNL